jgi:hypothetical protein
VHAGRAQPPAKTDRVDAHGDSLPPAALLRLGTLRLRIGYSDRNAALAPDGKTLAFCTGAGVCIIEVTTGEWVTDVRLDPTSIDRIDFTPDGRSLAVQSNK